jgi:hypothetical protein
LANSWKEDDAKRPAEMAQGLTEWRARAGWLGHPAMLQRWRQHTAS